MRVQNSGTATIACFGYYSEPSVGYSQTFDGGNWKINKIGRGNSGAQFAGTANLINGASVLIQTPGCEHGTWIIPNGALNVSGSIVEGTAPSKNLSPLVITVGNNPSASGTLTAGGLTLGFTGTNNAAINNAVTSGSNGTVSFTGNLQIGTTQSPANPESNTFTLSNGGKLKVGGTLQSALGSNQTNTFLWSGGQLAAGTITPGAGFTGSTSSITASTLTNNAGTLIPGDIGTAGRTLINGNYISGSASTLAIEIGGTTQATAFQTGQYDFVSITGSAVLSGSLGISVINGFTPTAGQIFTILSATTLSGSFGNIAFGSRLITPDGASSFLVSSSANKVVLSNYIAIAPPAILNAPASSAVTPGTSVTLSVSASASTVSPNSYQWFFNGTAIPGATGSSYTIASAQSGNGGLYQVAVANSAGTTTSTPATLSVMNAASIPTGLAAASGSGQVTLSWSIAADATGYNVKRASTPGGPYTLIAAGIADTNYTDTGLAAGGTSYYVVTGFNAASESSNSAEIAASPYTAVQLWRLGYFGSIAAAGAAADTADADSDGMPNLLEYALGQNPLLATSRAQPIVGVAGGRLTLTFTRSAADVTYRVESSTDLIRWNTISTNPGSVGNPVTVSDTVDISPSARRFLRLNISLP